LLGFLPDILTVPHFQRIYYVLKMFKNDVLGTVVGRKKKAVTEGQRRLHIEP
jgi:hypothetical protein